MAIKWKKFIHSKNFLLLISIGVSLIIGIRYTGIIFNQSVHGSISNTDVCILSLSYIYVASSTITYLFKKLDIHFSSLDFNFSQVKRKKLLKALQIAIIVYYLLALIFLFFPQNDWQDSTYIFNYFDQLILYQHHTWFLYIILLVGPAFIELVIFTNYYSYKNKYSIELNRLYILFDELQYAKRIANNPFTSNHLLHPFGEALKNISLITQSAVERQMKSEKMKIELITNVSHDLKTPLTSIISYLDLLKKEEMTPEANDYVTILSKRSEKLQLMIESLFDLAKTTSGNADLKLETMDLNRLVEQILADMDDRIKRFGKQLKINLAEDNLSFIADSTYMYRVCQNLFENTLKYSLNGTRIYIQTIAEERHIKLKITNTANYEMNFTEENIVERFSRGDEARTTEGNGLGLAIAKTYTEACSGEFEVKIDGDQFKVELKFQKV